MRALTLTARILEAPDPERVAVVCGDVALTYRTLLGLAADVALRLSAAGVAGEEPVAVLASRRPEFVIGALGTMLAGACFVPVDPDLSPARRDQLLAISRASKIVGPADSAVANILIDLTAPVSGCGCVDEATPNSLAYQLFTSGSTGVPKLVMIEHRSVCALLDGFERVAAAHGPVISTAVCPFSFDVSIWELFVALTNGGTVHILDGEAARQPNRLVGYIAKHGVNTAYVPPLALDMFVEESRSSSPLRRMLVGVEAIAQGTLQKLREKIPHLQIINGYGPTEVTICSTFFRSGRRRSPNVRCRSAGPWKVGRWRSSTTNWCRLRRVRSANC
ncbi:AMP-binding protein [Bradyrhizobium betae]|uniref:AMP-binding protein n=1 Tax=Bradyrhizobium betae TaxID=244734 RepID=UPI003D671D40